jgi:hypothetical protein
MTNANDSTDLNLAADGGGGADVLTRPAAPATPTAPNPAASNAQAQAPTAAASQTSVPSPTQAQQTLAAIGANFAAVANQAYADFKAKLPDLQLSPAEEDDVKWALNTLLAVGAAHIGLSDVDAAKLNQNRLDALSCLDDIEAIKANDGQKIVLQTVAAVFAKAQDVILGLVPVLVAKLG